MRDLNSISDSLSSDTDTGGQPRLMSRTLRLAHRDLMSAQALVFRASVAQAGVLQRLLWTALGRPLATLEPPADTLISASSLALDPYRRRLADSALETERLFKTLSAMRVCMAKSELEKEADIPERRKSVIAFAGGLVDRAIQHLDQTQTHLFRAAELTENRLHRLSDEEAAGTKRSVEESR
ncbi:MAG: hypothetical protein MPN21_26185 [Thermoanaerobaculia bacterium]|nr:hypothetical protein [Thermoanaerobaculia bacterium]